MSGYEKLSAAQKECINYHIYSLYADSSKRVIAGGDDVETIDMARVITRLAAEDGKNESTILAYLAALEIVDTRKEIAADAKRLQALHAEYNRAQPQLREGVPSYTNDYFTRKMDACFAVSGGEYTPD